MDSMQQPEPESQSFDGKEENLFDVDLIPMTGEEGGNGDQSEREPSPYIPGSFDPTDIQADLIPIQADLIPIHDYDQPRRTPVQMRPNPNRLFKGRPPEMDFDVVVKHRLTSDGQVIFEPQIRPGRGARPQQTDSQMNSNKVTVLRIVTQSPPVGQSSEVTTPGSEKKVVIRRIMKRKPGDPGYGTGRVVRVIKRVKQ